MTDEAVEPYRRPNLVQLKALTVPEIGSEISRLAAGDEMNPGLPMAIAIGWSGYFVREVTLVNGQIWLDCFRESETE